MPNVADGMATSAPPAPPPAHRRRRLILIGIAIVLAIIAGISLYPRDIDAATAGKMADRLLDQYRRANGESFHAFTAREDRIWADGWEFRWRYRPCPQFSSLRVWISRDGRRARFAELPDCAPTQGFMVSPLKV
jgi:hypothetical protein